MVTFLFVPPKSKMTFKIGYASPQTGNKRMKDFRTGSGLQMRFKALPKNAITVTVPIVFNEKKSHLQEKGFKSIQLDLSVENALEALCNDPIGGKFIDIIKAHMSVDSTYNILVWVKSEFLKVSGTDMSDNSRINLKTIDDTGYDSTRSSYAVAITHLMKKKPPIPPMKKVLRRGNLTIRVLAFQVKYLSLKISCIKEIFLYEIKKI